MAKFYAWSPIKSVDGEIPVGTEITAAKLKVDNEEWEQLVESRVARTTPYPKIPEGYLGSPKDFRRKQIVDNLGGLEDLELELDEE